MKKLLYLLLVLLFAQFTFAQQQDTLRVLVLSPCRIEVGPGCRATYEQLKKEVLANREMIKAQNIKEKNEDIHEFEAQPEYTKAMFNNNLDFCDSLSVDNYVSAVVREYIAYRLYRPFKIKPRIVLVSTLRVPSDLELYKTIANGKKNFFIINIPSLKFFKEQDSIKVRSRIELYSAALNKILLSQEHVGIPKSGLTDYPMCNGGLDCALVNAVCPAFFDMLHIIAAQHTGKKQ